MNRALVFLAVTALAGGAAGMLLWPRSQANAQLSPQACNCSPPTHVGSGRDRLSVYYCACPAMQCVATATAAGDPAVPPNIVQSCR